MLHNPAKVQTASAQAADDDVINIATLFGTLWRGKLLISVCTVIAVLIGGYYAYVAATPRFQSTSVVILDTREEQVSGLEGVLGGLSGDSTVVSTEVEVLRARSLMRKVVEKLNLSADPEFNGDLREPGTIARVKAAVRSILPARSHGVAEPDIAQKRMMDSVVSELLDKTTIRNVPNSLVFQISVETESPIKSVLIADTIAELYILEQLQVKFDATEQATDWLSARVIELQATLEAAEGRLQDFRASVQLVDEKTLLALDRQAKDLRERTSSSESQSAALQQRVEALRGATDRAAQAEVSDDAVLKRLLQESGGNLTPEDTRSFDLRFEQILARAELEATRSTDQLSSLRAGLAEFEAQIERQSADLITLQQYTREAESSRLIYEYFLNRMKETSVQQGIQQADSRVLSDAVIPNGPSAPRKSMILAISGLLGLMLGTGIVLLREASQNTFRSARELEEMTGRTVMGQIPQIPSRSRRDVISYLYAKPTSSAAEAVRNLRTSVLLSNLDSQPQVIVSTSAIPGEGKTTTSLALAQNLKQMGKRVLLIEGDIRRRVFGQYFQFDQERGLLAVLSGESRFDEVVCHDERIGDILIGEATKANAADVFSSDSFANFITEMRAIYDFIIIDTPPVLVVPDVRIIGQQADAIIFVVKWDSTSKSQVSEALRLFETANLRVSGLVLTQIDAAGMRRYGYGDSYGAYASYGKKYYND
ncbi:polysaccharide biosynthesis tyrosine autokinase [Frigidibacter mobilis]|uniref:non-specific protein-tyrosine kinase n=1 Tax=Frigidibacter mobilis TaxID=1335048 RepID=A0A159Z0R3_9RHOB|nr:polysaccharide biosynthesis tyrosine autokinase [Frigidibacter mobilis]AMY68512.1 succinoglycan biosynthesis transport protein ExoP, putative [Frigidibacter mobilis]